MSERTYNMFSAALVKAYHGYLTDYNTFCVKARLILNKARKHRKISHEDYLSLVDTYEGMRSALARIHGRIK